jgi:hypothetical protein
MMVLMVYKPRFISSMMAPSDLPASASLSTLRHCIRRGERAACGTFLPWRDNRIPARNDIVPLVVQVAVVLPKVVVILGEGVKAIDQMSGVIL